MADMAYMEEVKDTMGVNDLLALGFQCLQASSELLQFLDFRIAGYGVPRLSSGAPQRRVGGSPRCVNQSRVASEMDSGSQTGASRQ